MEIGFGKKKVRSGAICKIQIINPNFFENSSFLKVARNACAYGKSVSCVEVARRGFLDENEDLLSFKKSVFDAE